jgi:hypothetical protein
MKAYATILAVILFIPSLPAEEVKWLRAGINTNQPIWGIKGGLKFAIDPAGFTPRAPRGLIRLGYPVLPDGGYALVNFIAVEPIVGGRKGFSELEHSDLDDTQGKRFWTDAGDAPSQSGLDPGKLSNPAPGVEQLDVLIHVEKFHNGAHVYLVLSQRSDAPGELRLTVHAEPDSAPMEYCILTATMGNMVRARQLWLKDEVASSLKLYPEYKESAFADHTYYRLERLHRTPAGDVLVAITTDEQDLAAVRPFPGTGWWYYGGARVTQYWKKLNGAFREDLHTAVNARYTYWKSQQPIPGGISFENFELRERFYDGQEFIFGMTRKEPEELGFPAAEGR